MKQSKWALSSSFWSVHLGNCDVVFPWCPGIEICACEWIAMIECCCDSRAAAFYPVCLLQPPPFPTKRESMEIWFIIFYFKRRDCRDELRSFGLFYTLHDNFQIFFCESLWINCSASNLLCLISCVPWLETYFGMEKHFWSRIYVSICSSRRGFKVE